ncbi:uncharacterized protein [Haliotis cracherodii]|uniref:uncharacterized protein n=1 Tax=Haliotis cracherodii TaxID=6455 RepID=UPI0039E8D19B
MFGCWVMVRLLLLTMLLPCVDSPGTTVALHLHTDKQVELGQPSRINCTSDRPFSEKDLITIRAPSGYSVFHCDPSKPCLVSDDYYYLYYKLKSTFVLGVNRTTMEHNGTWTCQLNEISATGLLIVSNATEGTSSLTTDSSAGLTSTTATGSCGIQAGSVYVKVFLVYIIHVNTSHNR